MSGYSDTRVYIGRVPREAEKRDFERFFQGFGELIEVKLMAGFAFVEFKDPRDAKDAVAELNGKKFLGENLLIEFARGGSRRRDEPTRFSRPKRTENRLIVENLALEVSWQDLKDFVRPAGEVTYADVDRDGKGVVDFESSDDVANAIRKLDGIELKGKRVKLSEDPNPSMNPPPPPMRRERSRSPGGRGGGYGGFRYGGGSYDRRPRSPRGGGYSAPGAYSERSPTRYPPVDRDYPPLPSRRDDPYPSRNGSDYVPQRRASPRYDDRPARRPPPDSGRDDYGRSYR